MEVAAAVIDTIRMRRVIDCEHDWQKLNETEDQCVKCTVIATAFGKENLKRMAEGRRPVVR